MNSTSHSAEQPQTAGDLTVADQTGADQTGADHEPAVGPEDVATLGFLTKLDRGNVIGRVPDLTDRSWFDRPQTRSILNLVHAEYIANTRHSGQIQRLLTGGSNHSRRC